MFNFKAIGLQLTKKLLVIVILTTIFSSCTPEEPKQKYLEATAFNMNKNGILEEIIAIDSSLYVHIAGDWNDNTILELNFDGSIINSYPLPYYGKVLLLNSGGWILYNQSNPVKPTLSLYSKNGTLQKNIEPLSANNISVYGFRVLIQDAGFLCFLHYWSSFNFIVFSVHFTGVKKSLGVRFQVSGLR